MKKGLLLLLCVPLLVTGCKKVPELENGQDVVVELNDKKFTAEEFFDALKEGYGAGILVSMIDEYITDKELTEDLKKEAETSAEAQYNYYYVSFGKDTATWNSFLSYNGFINDQDFKDQLNIMHKQNVVLENYVKTEVVKEEEINKYYKDNIYGESNVRHILIKPDVKDDATDDEKKEAENKALQEAKELIEQLKKSKELEKDFEALAKEKSDDTGTKEEGGLLENVTNESNLVEEFWEAVLKLEVGKMTEEPVKTQFGYHIIYKVSQKEKPSLDAVKDKVLDAVANELLSTDNAVQVYKAGLREKYGMKIHDSIIKADYEAIMKQLQEN